MISKIICPYCRTKLKLVSITENKFYFGKFGVVKCDCDIYPIAADIIYLKKDDNLSNRMAVEMIQDGKYYECIGLLLRNSRRPQRILMVLFYQLVCRGIKINLRYLLKLLKFVSPEKSWFDFLLKRERNIELKQALDKHRAKFEGSGNWIDIGHSIGQLDRLVDTDMSVIGIDISYMSLLIARFYNFSVNTTLICSDINFSLPIENGFGDLVTIFVTFQYVYNQSFLVKEVARILHKGRLLLIEETFNKSKNTHYWGYGMSLKTLNSLLKNKFDTIHFYKTGNYSHTLKRSTLDEELDIYSVEARKK